jgi:RNA polymerase sigma-70 factor (ECF subfamily)
MPRSVRLPTSLRVVGAESAEAPPSPTDAELVVGLERGDEAAASVAWHRHSGRVVRLLRRMLGPDQEIDDLCQDVFLRLFSSVKNLRDPSALGSFIVAITLRVSQKELRRRWIGRWLRLTPTGSFDDASSIGDDRAREALRSFYRHLDALDAEARTVFVLRRIEGYELTEIAEVTSLSLATVKRRMAHAEERLERLVTRDDSLAQFWEWGKS